MLSWRIITSIRTTYASVLPSAPSMGWFLEYYLIVVFNFVRLLLDIKSTIWGCLPNLRSAKTIPTLLLRYDSSYTQVWQIRRHLLFSRRCHGNPSQQKTVWQRGLGLEKNHTERKRQITWSAYHIGKCLHAACVVINARWVSVLCCFIIVFFHIPVSDAKYAFVEALPLIL